ncbi:hypothetical protein PVAP13_2NG029406 [Panicum virgatum]|uniref:Uncharacterized protein n=1 Tax=Panicum virgatum TaxID=38727 RepID=A0A8T0VGZ7_PANVG|nr:hypothetical protein PVAP13_2NG029406 [Panicum virgatum]
MAAARSGVMSEAACQNTLEGCSDGEEVSDEDQRNEMNAVEPVYVVLDVAGPSNEHGRAISKRRVQLDDSSYGAETNAIDDSMISQVPPPRAKPKGRKMTGSEKKELKHNKERLEAMQNRQRGRPLGAKNKSKHTTRPGQHELKVMPMNWYSECDSDSGSADGMD